VNQLDAIPKLPNLPVPALLRQYGIRPDRRLGQNFLVEDAALRKVVAAAEISPADHILEIGPGLGSLTRYLAAVAGEVAAVELDHRLLPALKHVMVDFPRVRILQGDILEINPVELMRAHPYSVVANIPYYITSAVIRHLLTAAIQPMKFVLTLQQEVAERICAAPGDMSLLALSVQVFGKPVITAHLPAGVFYPVPKVDSAVVRATMFPTPLVPTDHLDDFFRLAKAGFSQKRKTLRNALAGGLRIKPVEAEGLLSAAELDPRRRAETLSIAEWGQLTRIYTSRDAG
jgi:16S rRNA (adenine1518-N6/adenine1519-N6)-dimethyltransferase